MKFFPFKPFVPQRFDVQAQAIVDVFEAREAKRGGKSVTELNELFFDAQRAAIAAGMDGADIIGLIYDLQMHHRAPERCRCGACHPETARLLAERDRINAARAAR